MGRASPVLAARKATVVLLVTLGVIVLVSGLVLETAPEGPGSGDMTALMLTKHQWTDIHVYTAFALAGVAIVHAYTNYRAILYHLGLKKLLMKQHKA